MDVEALDQVARRRADLDEELDTQCRSLGRLNQSLAREAADTSYFPVQNRLLRNA